MTLTVRLPAAVVVCTAVLAGLWVHTVRRWEHVQRLHASVDLTLGGAPEQAGSAIADAVAGGAVAVVGYGDDAEAEDDERPMGYGTPS